nr:hypothetical protein [Pseudomonas savastanoi]
MALSNSISHGPARTMIGSFGNALRLIVTFAGCSVVAHGFYAPHDHTAAALHSGSALIRKPHTSLRPFFFSNWAACGCKLWDFEIGYHSRNRVDPSSAQAYTWRQRPKNVNGRAGQKPRQSRPVSNAPGILPSCPIPTFPSISILSVMSIFVVAARQRI